MKVNTSKVKTFQSQIIDWFANNGRVFPWRQTRDPFKILIAEVLLKLTGPSKIEKAYDNIVLNYGTPQSMACADISELLEEFRPLGLHERARALIHIAHELVQKFGGIMPSSYEELIGLRGIGQYTANAILCLAFEERTPLLDENVSRVFRRCFSLHTDKAAHADREMWGLAHALLPEVGYREYNLGLIDLGSLVCKYSKALCDECPIVSICSTGGQIMCESNTDKVLRQLSEHV